jgi:hypothetical protein
MGTADFTDGTDRPDDMPERCRQSRECGQDEQDIQDERRAGWVRGMFGRGIGTMAILPIPPTIIPLTKSCREYGILRV